MPKISSNDELIAFLNKGDELDASSPGYMLARAVYAFSHYSYQNGHEKPHTPNELFNMALLAVLISAKLGNKVAKKLKKKIRKAVMKDAELVAMYARQNCNLAIMPLDTIEGLGFSILLRKRKLFFRILEFNNTVSSET